MQIIRVPVPRAPQPSKSLTQLLSQAVGSGSSSSSHRAAASNPLVPVVLLDGSSSVDAAGVGARVSSEHCTAALFVEAIQALLTVDSNRRPTARQATMLPFFQRMS